jgi:hypothetical protein
MAGFILSRPTLNKKSISLSLVVTGALGVIALLAARSRNAKDLKLKQNVSQAYKGPAPGRMWNINLDPHESGMAA